ncbi:MAG: aminoglycoside adenylyltransferase domain-containing protein, partial [Pyrinomonadaceae bacterium]
MKNSPPNIPPNLFTLLKEMVNDFPSILGDNLVGIYLWGSLTYEAFDESCSDVDSIIVTRRDINEKEFTTLEEWFEKSLGQNPWTHELDMRFVIKGEFLDKTSKCCGFQFDEFRRYGSDGNPIIWLNIGKSGITLWGEDAKEIAPKISDKVLNEALLLELWYLKDDLKNNAGDKSDLAFKHINYAILTACRIYYTAQHRILVSKEQGFKWALKTVPEKWHLLIQ